MPDTVRRANAINSIVRSRVEPVLAEEKDRMELFVRAIGVARVRVRIGTANTVYDLKSLVFWKRTAAA